MVHVLYSKGTKLIYGSCLFLQVVQVQYMYMYIHVLQSSCKFVLVRTCTCSLCNIHVHVHCRPYMIPSVFILYFVWQCSNFNNEPAAWHRQVSITGLCRQALKARWMGGVTFSKHLFQANPGYPPSPAIKYCSPTWCYIIKVYVDKH